MNTEFATDHILAIEAEAREQERRASFDAGFEQGRVSIERGAMAEALTASFFGFGRDCDSPDPAEVTILITNYRSILANRAILDAEAER